MYHLFGEDVGNLEQKNGPISAQNKTVTEYSKKKFLRYYFKIFLCYLIFIYSAKVACLFIFHSCHKINDQNGSPLKLFPSRRVVRNVRNVWGKNRKLCAAFLTQCFRTNIF